MIAELMRHLWQSTLHCLDLDGLLYEANATGGTLSSTKTTTGTGTNVDEADYNNLVCDVNSACNNDLIQGAATSLNGVNSSYQRKLGNPIFTPFANSGILSGDATIEIEAFYQGTASRNGAATAFTIDGEVPEPGSWALLALSLVGILMAGFRKQSFLRAATARR